MFGYFWKLKEKKVKENYDVIVVGAGPAGIMTCYELYLKNPELEVLLIDKGHDVMNRHCPITVSYTHLTLPTT